MFGRWSHRGACSSSGRESPEPWSECDSGLSRIEFASDAPSGLSVSVRKVEGSAAEVRVNALVNRTVFPEASDYVLLREELSIPGHDPTFEAALPSAAKLATAS